MANVLVFKRRVISGFPTASRLELVTPLLPQWMQAHPEPAITSQSAPVTEVHETTNTNQSMGDPFAIHPPPQSRTQKVHQPKPGLDR
jgi:hypothetical protein